MQQDAFLRMAAFNEKNNRWGWISDEIKSDDDEGWSELVQMSRSAGYLARNVRFCRRDAPNPWPELPPQDATQSCFHCGRPSAVYCIACGLAWCARGGLNTPCVDGTPIHKGLKDGPDANAPNRRKSMPEIFTRQFLAGNVKISSDSEGEITMMVEGAPLAELLRDLQGVEALEQEQEQERVWEQIASANNADEVTVLQTHKPGEDIEAPPMPPREVRNKALKWLGQLARLEKRSNARDMSRAIILISDNLVVARKKADLLAQAAIGALAVIGASDPTFCNDKGQRCCVYCGPLDESNPDAAAPAWHSPDCLWALANLSGDDEESIAEALQRLAEMAG